VSRTCYSEWEGQGKVAPTITASTLATTPSRWAGVPKMPRGHLGGSSCSRNHLQQDPRVAANSADWWAIQCPTVTCSRRTLRSYDLHRSFILSSVHSPGFRCPFKASWFMPTHTEHDKTNTRASRPKPTATKFEQHTHAVDRATHPNILNTLQ
jgi:hypothetical protein